MKHALELPWGFKHPGIKYYDSSKKVSVWEGAILPQELRRFKSQDFSWARWVEDEWNGSVLPPEKAKVRFTPREHQLEAAKKIFKSYGMGQRGFLLADETGLGKTLSGLAGVSAIAKNEGFGARNRGTLLIVCPKGVIPQWRHTLHSYPISTSLLRVLIINYERLNRLLIPPPQNRLGKKARTKNRSIARNGKPAIDFDYIIFDESHMLKNFPQSTMSVAAANVAQLNKNYVRGRSPFTIYSTATPGATPLNFAVMGGIFAPFISDKPEAKKVTPDTWGPFLQEQGFAVKEGKVNWTWATTPWFGKNSDDPKERAKYERAQQKTRKLQRKDAQRIGQALKHPNAPFIMRKPTDLENWPEQQLIPLPTEMTSKQQPIYEDAWTRFRKWLNLTPAKADPQGALVEMLRYRQKTSLLKVEQVSENIIDWVNNDNQVYVSCQFTETIDEYKKIFDKKGISYCEMTGRTSSIREEERLKFQKGEAKVALCSVVAGISLHAEESLPDGTKATSNTRITVIHDVRQNNLDTKQSLGRAHRDGKNSLTYFPYLEGTIDEKVINSFTNKEANMSSMMGSEQEDAEELERLFREAAARTRL